MNYKTIIPSFFILLFISFAATAQSHIKYYGYYYNSGYHHETNYHTNITMVVADFNMERIRSELTLAKDNNVSVIISVEPFLFTRTGNGVVINPAAVEHWNSLTQFLVANNFLVPNNPEAGTVVAFYPIDEPEIHGLTDKFVINPPIIGWKADPGLETAINIIRTHPYSANVPIAVITSQKYKDAKNGLQLFDWIGYDNYDLPDPLYLASFDILKSELGINGNKRTILVPQACIIYYRSSKRRDETLHSASAMYQKAASDSSVIMIMPFIWFSITDDQPGDTSILGLREPSVPWLDPNGILDRNRAEYENIGSTIKYRLF